MSQQKKSRRSVLTGVLAAFASIFAFTKASAARLTPEAMEGPFYPIRSMRFADIDNDLVKISGLVREAGGETFILKGRVLARDGSVRPGLRVEIWQTDMNGKYLHPGDDRNVPADAGFQGFGHDITRSDGSYWFRTIIPAQYPGRTPHIHVKVFNNRREILTTQFYIKGNARNRSDFLYQEMSARQKQAVLMDISNGSDGLDAVVDITV